LLALLCLLLGVSPAQAAIGVIDPRSAVAPSLGEAEFAKLKALQEIRPPLAQSPLSPDEASLLINAGNQLVFLDIRDGSTRPVNVAALASIRLLSNLSWRDANSLIFVGADLSRRALVTVTIDRASGGVSAAPVALPAPPLQGLTALSPDGRRLLVATLVDGEPQTMQADAFDSPFAVRVPLGLGRSRGFDEAEPALLVAAASVALLVVDLPSGDATPLLTLPPGGGIQALAWSPNGNRLALSRLSLQQDEIVSPIKSLVNQEVEGALPPDQNPFYQSNVVDLIDFATGEVRQGALRATESDGGIFGNLAWSPDGGVLAAALFAPTRLAGRANPIFLFPERATYRFYAGDGRFLSAFSHPDIEAPIGGIALLNGEEVVINTVLRSDASLFYYNRASGELRRLPLPAGFSAGARVARQGRQIVFSHSSFLRAPELYRVNLDGGGLTALTFVNAEPAKLNQVRADEVSFTLANGQQRAGYLIQPAGAAFPPQNVPIVVWQEGGPFSTVANSFAANVENPYNLLPNFGVAVLFMPLVGRYGYGVERFRALYDGQNFGEIDIDEQAEIVRQMVEGGWTSPGKVGITGCSYGGYFTAQSVARHPDLYAAASTQCTLLDLPNEWQFGDRGPAVSFIMGGPPTTNVQGYADASPLYGVARARTAMLIFHGVEDFLPIRLAATLHDQFQTNGAAVNMLAFLGEGHGLAQPNSQLTAGQWQIQWFRQYLK
jgi:dipeptidyl aminopeptidase/acylaminoacyl peptidase